MSSFERIGDCQWWISTQSCSGKPWLPHFRFHTRDIGFWGTCSMRLFVTSWQELIRRGAEALTSYWYLIGGFPHPKKVCHVYHGNHGPYRNAAYIAGSTLELTDAKRILWGLRWVILVSIVSYRRQFKLLPRSALQVLKLAHALF